MNKPNGFKIYYKKIHDAPLFLAIPLFILSLFSIFIGFIFKDLFVGLGTDAWFTIDSLNNFNLSILESEFLPFYIKNVPFIFSLFGIFLVFFFNNFFSKIYYFLNTNNEISAIALKLYRFFSYKWYIDVLYNKLIVNFFFNISYSYVKNIDRGLIELIGPLGIVRSLNYLMNKLNLLQTGFIYNYLFIFIISIIFFLFFFYNNLQISAIEYFFLFIFLIFFKKS